MSAIPLGTWAVFRGGRSAHCVVSHSGSYPVGACGDYLPSETRDLPAAPRCQRCARRWTQFAWQWEVPA